MGVGVPPFKRLWPALFLIAAIAALVDFLFIKRVVIWAILFLAGGAWLVWRYAIRAKSD